MIGATLLIRLIIKPKYTIFIVIIANIKKALVLKRRTNPTIKVLIKYYKQLDVFLQKKANKLIKHQLYNYKIILKKGKQPRFGPLYKIFQNEL